METCHNCGCKFSQLSQHWRRSDCPQPQLTQKQWDILNGLMLGDARLVDKKGRKPYISVSNTSQKFLQWFNNIMGQLTTGVKEHREKQKEHHAQLYYCNTRTHSEFNKFSSWYQGSTKKPPKIEFNPLVVKCWYVSDGTVATPDHARPTVRFCSRKSENVKENMREPFLEFGFSPTWSGSQLVFDASESRRLLEWMGDPLPGFTYKWPSEPDIENTYSMPDKRQWKDKEEFYSLRYEQDFTYSEMAEKWDCSISTVHKWDEKYDFPP